MFESPAMGMMRILVIRGGAVGDFILTLPAIAALRRRFPGARLVVLGYPAIAELAVAGGLADEVRPIESAGLAGFFVEGGPLDAKWAGFFASFDLIVSYAFDSDGVFAANIRKCASGRLLSGPHRPDERKQVHAAEVYLGPLEVLGITGEDPVPRLRLRPGPAEPAAPALALHPGSGSERKNWPEARWTELLGRICEETDWNLLLVGGEAEGGRASRLGMAVPEQRRSVAENLSLGDLARRLAACAGFVGHDSGITHLAAAVGLPCLVLWADTREAIWRPLGPGVVILSDRAGLRSLEAGRVFAALPGRREHAR